MTAEEYVKREEERASWRLHRRNESALFEAAWLAHVAKFPSVHAAPEPSLRAHLIRTGQLVPLADRFLSWPTLWLVPR